MKKLISLLTVLMLSLQMTTVFADGVDMTFDKVSGAPGETVTVNVVLSETMTATSFGFEFTYDTDALELTGATGAGATFSPNFTTMPYQAQWNATGDKDYSGTIATLTFKIKDDAVAGTYDIDATWSMASEDWGSDEVNYDSSWDEVIINYVDGSITVEAPAPAGPKMNATLTDDVVAITATPDGEFAGKFIVAAYNGEELAEVIVTAAAATASATITADYDDVKVMWWDSLTSLTSIVDAIDL